MKKLLLIFIPMVLCACSAEAPNKTYNILKNFDKNEYHLVYKDVTEDKNSLYEITVASYEEKYYYFDELNTIIQRDNKKYTLNDEMFTYNVEDIFEYEDYLYGMFDVPKEQLKKYKTGTTKLYGEKLIYEEFVYNENIYKYYYKNEELRYVKIKGTNNKTFEIIELDKKIDKEWFDLPENYSMITY